MHAVHIDYANRVESGAEADFVRRWCEARGVGVKVRVVDEVKREVTARDMYEAKSRAIRFGEYAAAMSRWGGRGIFFGHHEGDLHENVISNVMKGAQLLNIAGLTSAANKDRARIILVKTAAAAQKLALGDAFSVSFLRIFRLIRLGQRLIPAQYRFFFCIGRNKKKLR